MRRQGAAWGVAVFPRLCPGECGSHWPRCGWPNWEHEATCYKTPTENFRVIGPQNISSQEKNISFPTFGSTGGKGHKAM